MKTKKYLIPVLISLVTACSFFAPEKKAESDIKTFSLGGNWEREILREPLRELRELNELGDIRKKVVIASKKVKLNNWNSELWPSLSKAIRKSNIKIDADIKGKVQRSCVDVANFFEKNAENLGEKELEFLVQKAKKKEYSYIVDLIIKDHKESEFDYDFYSKYFVEIFESSIDYNRLNSVKESVHRANFYNFISFYYAIIEHPRVKAAMKIDEDIRYDFECLLHYHYQSFMGDKRLKLDFTLPSGKKFFEALRDEVISTNQKP
jgi:hypothetical protein